jgi:hypothetical protein
MAMSIILPQHDTDGANAFDFFHGAWRVAHRRLRARLCGDTNWENFPGSCVVHAILGGHGNIDDNVIELPAGAYRAATMRAFDPETRRWAIWWLDARNPLRLDTPMVGEFRDGEGTFFADDVFEGRAIRVRFLWMRTRTASPRWEQAFSADGGETWETNWIMDFSRAH